MFRGNFIYLMGLCTVVLASCGDTFPDKPCACRDKEEQVNAELAQMEMEIQKYESSQKSSYKGSLNKLFEKARYYDELYDHCQKVYDNNKNDKCSLNNVSFWDCGEYMSTATRTDNLKKKYTGDWKKDSTAFFLENNPKNPACLLSYLKREKYDDWPVFYGPYWDSAWVDTNATDTIPVYVKRFMVAYNGVIINEFVTNKEAKAFIKAKKLKGAKISIGYVIAPGKPVYSPTDSGKLFPRMFDQPGLKRVNNDAK